MLVGGELTYAIIVVNNGPSTGVGVTLTGTLFGDLRFVSATASPGSCSGTATVTCSLGNIASGEHATLAIAVIPREVGTTTNTAGVTGKEADPRTVDNTSRESTVVQAAANLSVTEVGSAQSTSAGSDVGYSHIVTNRGPSEATGVTLTTRFFKDVSFVSASPSQGECREADGTVTCMLGSVGSGDEAMVTIVVIPNTTGDLTGTVTVTGNESDPRSGDNTLSMVRISVTSAVPEQTLTPVLHPTGDGKSGWLQRFLILSGILFCIGLYGALARRNLITVFMSIELMFNAVNIALVAFSKYVVPVGVEEQLGRLLTGQIFALFIITVAAAEIALGLAIAMALYRNRETVAVTDADIMKR